MKTSTLKILLALFLLSFGCWSKSMAQQESIYTQYMFNRMLINPAYAGVKGCTDLTMMYRHQWLSFAHAPRQIALSGHTSIDRWNSGIGVFASGDFIGAFRNTSLGFNYAYHLKLGEQYHLSLGLQGALLQFSIDEDLITVANSSDVTFASQTGQTVFRPDAGAGFFLVSERFYVGASALHIVPVKFPVYEQATANRLIPHFFLTAGGDIKVADDWKVSPSIFFRYASQTPVQMDVTALLTYKKMLWGGAGYRWKDAALFYFGVFLKENLRLGYSFDYTVSGLNIANTFGTHELMLNYTICKKRTGPALKRKVVTPEYF